MFYTVYKITNLIDNKIYIGKHQTKDLNDGYMGSGKRIKASIKKYGLENFKKEILYIFDDEKTMNAKEAELVSEDFCARQDTYNICFGGKGGWGFINKNKTTEELKLFHTLGAKASYKIQNKKYWERYKIDESYRLKRKESMKNHKSFLGRSHTQETKLQMSNSHKGLHIAEKNSQFGTCWIYNKEKSIKIPKEELNKYIELGYTKGRKMTKNKALYAA